jgi:aryl-alcohol dehydrogenase-like predicted oxidoreductase
VARGEPGAGLGGAARWQTFEAAKLDELRTAGEGRTAFLLRYTLTHPYVHTIIVGTLHPAHLQEDVQAVLRGPLSPEVYAEARRRLDAVGEKAVGVS